MGPAATDQIEWIGDDAGVDGIRAGWDALMRDAPDPFAEPRWFDLWWDAFGARHDRRVAVARRDGEITGVLPMMSVRGRLKAMSNYHSPRFSPAAVDEQARAALLAAAMEARVGEVHFHGLPVDSGDAAAAREAADVRRRLLHTEPAHASPFTDTTGNFEEYRRTVRSAPFRRRRKVEREHDVAFRFDDGGPELDADLDAGFELEGSGWKRQSGTAILSRPETERFYRGLAHAERDRGDLRIAWLHVDGRPVAWNLMLLRDRRLHLIKTCYAEDARDVAPGILVNLMVIERCFADGLESYEMLGAADEWKMNFATGTRSHERLWAWSRRPVPVARRLMRRHLVPLARRLRRRGT